MVTRKEDTSRRVARRKYEEKNKELRKEKNANFQTMIPRELFEEINAFLNEKGMTKVEFIKKAYLELQAPNPNDNGFKQLTTKLLSWRFRCKKSHTTVGLSYKQTSELIDVDNFKNIKEFSSIMGYINTPADKQQKGIRGHEK